MGGVWGGCSKSADPRSDGSGLHECEPQECVGTSNCGRMMDRPDVIVQVRVMLFCGYVVVQMSCAFVQFFVQMEMHE